MIEAVVSVGAIGMLAAVALGVAAKKFAVEVDPRELAVLEVLSGANCGACGYPGCGAYAKAVAAGEASANAKAVAAGEASASLCTPGGADTIEKVAHIMGVRAELSEPQVAVVFCLGETIVKRQANIAISVLPIALRRNAWPAGRKPVPADALGSAPAFRFAPSALLK